MKSRTETKKENIDEYPCLMTINDMEDGMVVLFSKPKEGVVVKLGNEEEVYELGQIQYDWHMDYFKPFEGKVIIEND